MRAPMTWTVAALLALSACSGAKPKPLPPGPPPEYEPPRGYDAGAVGDELPGAPSDPTPPPPS